MKRLPTLLVLLFLVLGCSDQVWVKEGATQKDFARDKGLCMEKSHTPDAVSAAAPSEKTVDKEKFTACMGELGYVLEYERLLNPRRLWRRD